MGEFQSLEVRGLDLGHSSPSSYYGSTRQIRPEKGDRLQPPWPLSAFLYPALALDLLALVGVPAASRTSRKALVCLL